MKITGLECPICGSQDGIDETDIVDLFECKGCGHSDELKFFLPEPPEGDAPSLQDEVVG